MTICYQNYLHNSHFHLSTFYLWRSKFHKFFFILFLINLYSLCKMNIYHMQFECNLHSYLHISTFISPPSLFEDLCPHLTINSENPVLRSGEKKSGGSFTLFCFNRVNIYLNFSSLPCHLLFCKWTSYVDSVV